MRIDYFRLVVHLRNKFNFPEKAKEITVTILREHSFLMHL